MRRTRDPFRKMMKNCLISGRHSTDFHNREKLEVCITENDLRTIWTQQQGRCFWFDVPLDLGLLFRDHPEWYKFHPMAPSVDRKDEKIGYQIDNIVICCRFANVGRSVYPFDRTKSMIEILRGSPKPKTALEEFMV
jgi:hypothetical protein